MKKKLTKRMLLGVLAAAMFGISANDAEAQTFTNTGSGTYNASCGAVIRLKAAGTDAAITGNNIGTATLPIPGVVEYTRGDASSQTVKPYYYNQLVLSGTNPKTVPTGIFVLGTQCPSFLTGYGELANYPYYIASGSGAVTYENGGTFNYAGNTVQNIFPDEYQTIALTGGTTATVREGESVTVEVITSAAAEAAPSTVGESTLSIVGDLTISGIDGTTTSTLAGNLELVAGAGATPTEFGTLTTGLSPLVITGNTTTADNTVITVGGVGTVDFDGTLALAGNLVVGDGSAGDRGAVNMDGAVTIESTGTLDFGTNSNLYISSTITNAGDGANLVFDCSSNVYYDATTADQLVLPTGLGSYGNLFLEGGNKVGGTAGTLGADKNVSLCGNFDLKDGDLTMITNSGSLIMTGDVAKTATYESEFEVIGRMQRATGALGEYTFNNAATTVTVETVSGTPGTANMALNIQRGVQPESYVNNSDVKRKVTVDYQNTDWIARFKVGYLANELPTGLTPAVAWGDGLGEGSLKFYEADDAATPTSEKLAGVGGYTRTNVTGATPAFGTVAMGGIIGGTADVDGTMEKVIKSGNDLVLRSNTKMNNIADGRWSNPNSWDEGRIPTKDDDVELLYTAYVGINGPFLNTAGPDNNTEYDLASKNARSEALDYVGGVSAANTITIAAKPTGSNPALIIGNEDNGPTYVFKTEKSSGNTLINNNTSASGVAFNSGIGAKTNDPNPGYSGIWVTPWSASILPGSTEVGGVPTLQTNQISNAGTVNNEGVIEVGN